MIDHPNNRETINLDLRSRKFPVINIRPNDLLEMKIHINGEERSFPNPSSPFTLAALVESMGMKPDRVAVELNREIAPRGRWADTPLKDGDRLEIVHFVGGGNASRFSW